jgi:hypothetical protein
MIKMHARRFGGLTKGLFTAISGVTMMQEQPILIISCCIIPD